MCQPPQISHLNERMNRCMSEVKKNNGDNNSMSLDSLLNEFLTKESTGSRFASTEAKDEIKVDPLAKTRAFDLAKIPEEDSKLKDNAKEFEQSVKKYFSENHETDVDEKLTLLYDDKEEVTADEACETEDDALSTFESDDDYFADLEEQEQDPIDRKIDHAFSDKSDRDDSNRKGEDPCFCGKFKFEYTEPCQEMEISKSLQKSARTAFHSMAAVLLFTLISIYTDLAPSLQLPHIHYLEPGKYSPVFALVSLQLLLFCVIFTLDSIILGIKNLFSGHPTPESAAFLVALVASVQAVVSVFVKFSETGLVVFCSIGSLGILAMSLYEYWKSRAMLMNFRVISMKKPKLGTEKLGFDSAEGEIFSKYLSDGSDIFTTKEKDFVDNFFARSQTPSASDKKTSGLLLAGALFGLLLGALNFYLSKDFYTSVNVFAAAFFITVPTCIFLVGALPYYLATKSAFRTHSAIIGLAAGDYYANASVISFEDTAVFPPKQVKVTSIKTFGKNRIDNVIITMAQIFGKLGGPLSDVFRKSVSNILANESTVTLTETAPDGLRLSVDGSDCLVGLSSFMMYYGIDTPPDSFDDSFLQSSGSVLYLAVGNELAAKFYIKYSVNNQFESLLHSLYNAGVCTGIKTIDPCITNELICSNLKHSNYPISVLKCKNPDLLFQDTAESVDSGVVSASGLFNFLKTFLLANKLRLTVKSNSAVKLTSIIIGIALAGFFVLTHNAAALSILFLLLFQLLWLLPIALISYLSK